MKNSEQLIQTIREQEIRPVPKWRFLLKNGLVWTGFLVAVVLGALAFSVILFTIQQADFNMLEHLTHSRLEMFLGLLPVAWILFLILFLGVAFFSIRHSKRGYKFTVARLVGFSAAFSILLGTLFFIAGGAQGLEQAFAVRVALYESVQEKKIRMWSMPDEGFLSGEIREAGEEELLLEDFNGHTWQIGYREAFVRPSVLLEPGERIKLTGSKESAGRFRAEEIRPWGGRGRQHRGR